MTPQRFRVLDGAWAVVRLPPDAYVPAWALRPAAFSSITRTAEELSVICRQELVPAGIRNEGGWAVLALVGPFAFDAVGVLASFAVPLREAGISLLAISTFDTDYVLVSAARLEAACAVLTAAGHTCVAD